MTDPQLQPCGQPPDKQPPVAIACGFDDDWLRELGDRMANLTLREAVVLVRYLRAIHFGG